jgi:hypothetical protein
MLDPMAVLDRFGDEEFLRELWLRARGQLPLELAGVEELRSDSEPQAELGKRLHKLRGLIANFLEGGDAILELRHCEELCRASGGVLPEEVWSGFLATLREESAQLESWLTERGFPCS